MGNKKKLRRVPLQGQTVAEVIEIRQEMPQDAILVCEDNDGGARAVKQVTKGVVYHSNPKARYSSEYSFVPQRNIDNPMPADVDFYASELFQSSKRAAVELS